MTDDRPPLTDWLRNPPSILDREDQDRLAEAAALLDAFRDLLAEVPTWRFTEHRGGNYGSDWCLLCKQYCNEAEGGSHTDSCLVTRIKTAIATVDRNSSG